MKNFKPITCLTIAFIMSACLSISVVKAEVLSWLSQPDQSPGLALNGSTGAAKISANGRFIAFISDASNIVAGDDNQRADLYIQDTLNQTVQRFTLPVALRSFSAPTSDGRYIVLTTESTDPINFSAPNLVYLIDTVNNTFTQQNLNLNGDAYTLNNQIYLADDASQMIFITSENLSPLHTDSSNQIYAKNLNNNQYTLLSIAPDEQIAESLFRIYDVSVNQQFIAIQSLEDSNLLPGITLTGGNDNLIILDLSDNSYSLATIQPDGSSTQTGFFGPRSVSISNSGKVVYISDMSDLVSNDTNDNFDVFFFDGTTNSRINLDSNGSQISASVSISDQAVISPNDSIISYSSFSDQLVANDNNQTYDTFIYNPSTNVTTRASSLNGGEAAGDSTFPTDMSADGQTLVMRSYAKDYGLGTVINGQQQTFIYSITEQQLTQMLPAPSLTLNTAHSSISQSRISSDQQFAFYLSQSPYLSADTVSDYIQFNSADFDLFQLDRATDTHSIIARRVENNGFDVSASGQYVVFSSNYFQPAATFELSSREVFLYDRINNTYTQVGPGSNPKVNDAGMVVFTSSSDLLPADNNSNEDIYLYDSADNSLSLVSKNMTGDTSLLGATNPFISDSATEVWVGFSSRGSDFINNDTNNKIDVFMYNWPGGNTIRVTQLPDGTGADGFFNVRGFTEISAEGEFVIFSSDAQNLTNDDYTDAARFQVFTYERATQAIDLISPNLNGEPTNDEQSIVNHSISNSGRYISFTATGRLDDFGIFNSPGDVFLYDQQTQQTTLVSQGVNLGFSANGISDRAKVVEDLSLSPPLVGVIFDGAADLTGIANHSGHTESFLYQRGGPNVELTIEVIGTGTVSGSFGVNCMTTCDSNYPLGTELNLLAVPDAGFVFDRWSSTRNNCSTTQNCTVTMDRAKTIQAIFIDENDIIFKDAFE